MLVNKEECSFSITSHTGISSNMGLYKQISVKYDDVKYLLTNAGFIKDRIHPHGLFIGKKFYLHQAEKHIEALPAVIELLEERLTLA